MNIRLTIKTNPDFIHSVLFGELRSKLLTAHVILDKLTVTAVAVDVVTAVAVVYPKSQLSELSQDEVQTLPQDTLR